jgi:hypothetical protein
LTARFKVAGQNPRPFEKPVEEPGVAPGFFAFNRLRLALR